MRLIKTRIRFTQARFPVLSQRFIDTAVLSAIPASVSLHPVEYRHKSGWIPVMKSCCAIEAIQKQTWAKRSCLTIHNWKMRHGLTWRAIPHDWREGGWFIACAETHPRFRRHSFKLALFYHPVSGFWIFTNPDRPHRIRGQQNDFTTDACIMMDCATLSDPLIGYFTRPQSSHLVIAISGASIRGARLSGIAQPLQYVFRRVGYQACSGLNDVDLMRYVNLI